MRMVKPKKRTKKGKTGWTHRIPDSPGGAVQSFLARQSNAQLWSAAEKRGGSQIENKPLNKGFNNNSETYLLIYLLDPLRIPNYRVVFQTWCTLVLRLVRREMQAAEFF